MPTRFFTGRHRFFSEWGFLAAEFFYGFFSKILSDFLPKALTDRKNCDIIIDGFAPFVNLGQSQRGEIFPKKRRKKRPKMAKKRSKAVKNRSKNGAKNARKRREKCLETVQKTLESGAKSAGKEQKLPTKNTE